MDSRHIVCYPHFYFVLKINFKRISSMILGDKPKAVKYLYCLDTKVVFMIQLSRLVSSFVAILLISSDRSFYPLVGWLIGVLQRFCV